MSLLYTSTVPSPSGDNSEETRSTVQPVREGALPEIDNTKPEAIVTDSTDEAMGLSHRNAGAIHEPRRAPTFVPAMMPYDFTANDREYANKGRAAGLEAAGVFGHGTMQYDESITPQITGDERLGGDTFSAERQAVQGQAGKFMTGVVQDNTYQAIAATAATRQARKAYSASLYEGWTG